MGRLGRRRRADARLRSADGQSLAGARRPRGDWSGEVSLAEGIDRAGEDGQALVVWWEARRAAGAWQACHHFRSRPAADSRS